MRIVDERPGRPIVFAQFLRDDKTYVVPVLDRARILRVVPAGLLLTGTEVAPRGRGIKSPADYYP